MLNYHFNIRFQLNLDTMFCLCVRYYVIIIHWIRSRSNIFNKNIAVYSFVMLLFCPNFSTSKSPILLPFTWIPTPTSTFINPWELLNSAGNFTTSTLSLSGHTYKQSTNSNYYLGISSITNCRLLAWLRCR